MISQQGKVCVFRTMTNQEQGRHAGEAFSCAQSGNVLELRGCREDTENH